MRSEGSSSRCMLPRLAEHGRAACQFHCPPPALGIFLRSRRAESAGNGRSSGRRVRWGYWFSPSSLGAGMAAITLTVRRMAYVLESKTAS